MEMTTMPPPNEANETNPEVAAPQEIQPETLSHANGSATLDAEAASTAHPTGEPIAEPVATNFSARTGETKTADASTHAGSSSEEGEPQAGRVHLQNNPDAPDPNRQETLPTVNPIELPIDPDVNLPE